MHPHFHNWYISVSLQTSAELLENRWKAVEAYAATLDSQKTSHLIRLFLGQDVSPEFVREFSEALVKIDTSFPVTNNKEELSLLAGAVFMAAHGKNLRGVLSFALGLKAAAFPANRVKPTVPEIFETAVAYVISAAETARPDDFGILFVDFEKSIATKLVEFSQSPEADKEKAAQGAAKALVGGIKKNYDNLAWRTRKLAEESQILWWLFGEQSLTLKVHRSEVSQYQYALISAEELRSRTGVLPPPSSARAFLSRALKQCDQGDGKKMSLWSFLQLCEKGWLSETIEKWKSTPHLDLLPITAGIIRSKETDKQVTWNELWAKTIPGVSSKTLLTPIDVAEQWYSELMFLSALQ